MKKLEVKDLKENFFEAIGKEWMYNRQIKKFPTEKQNVIFGAKLKPV